MNDAGKHDLLPRPSKSGATVKMVLDEDWWLGYQNGPEFRRKAAAEEVSYFRDHHIEKFTKHFLQGTSQYLSDTTPETHERTVRFFARENRTRRRMLASSLVEMLKTTPEDKIRTRVLLPSRPGDPHGVFVLFPALPDKPHEQYRTVRREYLNACCQVVKLQHPDALDVVGFATKSGRRGLGSEDAAYYDARNWNEGFAQQARRLQRDLRILANPRIIEQTEYEYPRPPAPKQDPNGPFGPLRHV